MKSTGRGKGMDERRRAILYHIGERIKNYRRELGYSREYVAGYIKITPRTLAAYERGEREMSVKTAVDLARLYRTTLTRLTDYKNITDTML